MILGFFCANNHPFAGNVVGLEKVLQEHLILRELGSGSRGVFEDMLRMHNYSINNSCEITEISQIGLIKDLVKAGAGVSFVYESTIKNDEDLSQFEISDVEMKHEFNYVYLKHAKVDHLIAVFE